MHEDEGLPLDTVGCWMLLGGVPLVVGFFLGALCAHYGWMGF